MKTKRTKGPWGIHRDNQLDCDIAYIRDSENNEIAIVYNAAEGSDNAEHARLIAVAPELVAALEGPLSRAKVGEPLTLTPEEIDRARAALEKAGRGVEGGGA